LESSTGTIAVLMLNDEPSKWRRLFCNNSVKIISPPLHHFLAFGQVLRIIVSSPDRVPFAVGKLTFNYIRAKLVFVQDRTSP
jgi:hypothetical protein